MSSSAAIGIDWLRIGVSMATVLLILAGLFWVLRRLKAMQLSVGPQRKLQVIETLNLGPRQKIALLRVGTREILVGVSASQFTALADWEGTDQTPSPQTGNQAVAS